MVHSLSTPKLAVIMTCFNRKDITFRCLNNLFNFYKDIDVYLVDDQSTDGTSELVSKYYPQVKIILSNGNLFWSRGMHLAWSYAIKKKYDFFLWLNDDVIIYPNCFKEILECSMLVFNKAIITGILESHDKSEILYGGYNSNNSQIIPNGLMQNVIKMNGNVVLVPQYVFSILGNIDPVYHHDLGDVDYSLRANSKGINVISTRVVVGSCESNELCRVRLSGVTVVKRFKRLYSPLGGSPFINFYFRRKHFGILNALLYFFYLHILNFLPDSLNKLIFKNKY